MLDKTLALDVPVWIVSLDLSKAFDKVKWESLWEALSEHGVSDHILWVLQRIYCGQTGRIEDNNADGDLRFADDLLLFVKTFQETKFLLDELVICLAEVGLQLNVRKTKVLTTQSQSPTEVPLRNGQAIEVIDSGSTHKWLGCMLAAMHCKYWQSQFGFRTSPPCCVENVLCKQTIFGKQKCCNARLFQLF